MNYFKAYHVLTCVYMNDVYITYHNIIHVVILCIILNTDIVVQTYANSELQLIPDVTCMYVDYQ